MDFSTGELTFRINYRRSAFGNKVSINTTATEITCVAVKTGEHYCFFSPMR
jgi:hypothetical protein